MNTQDNVHGAVTIAMSMSLRHLTSFIR